MSVAEYQLLNKVLKDKDYSIISDNALAEENFPQTLAEFRYIQDFYEEYNCIPDKEKFTSVFPNFEYFNVTQSTKSIIDDIREQTLFQRSVRILNAASELFQQDANKGVEYIRLHMDELQPTYNLPYTDIIHSDSRLQSWKERQNNPEKGYIELPFAEMQKDLYGFQRGEELFLWLAKSGVGKTQILMRCVEHASKQGYRVGVISPELSTEQVGYRFDTSRGHFSNSALQQGLLISGYEDYMKNLLQSTEHVLVVDNSDVKGDVDIQKCENFVKQEKLDILFIDGIVYIRPNIKEKYYNQTVLLGEASRGLKTLSDIYSIPVVGVVQARRRDGEKKEEDNISDKESIYNAWEVAHYATRIVSINAVANAIKLYVAKNRYGKELLSYIYSFDYDRLLFTFIPQLEDIKNSKDGEENMEKVKDGLKHIF